MSHNATLTGRPLAQIPSLDMTTLEELPKKKISRNNNLYRNPLIRQYRNDLEKAP